MPTTVTGLSIDPLGLTCEVSISDAAGVTTSAYTSQNGSTNVTFPVTIQSRATYYFTKTGTFSVSMKIGGIETGTVDRLPLQVVLDRSASYTGGVGPAFLPSSTLLDALGDRNVNVLSAAYGADPSGVSDSTTAFQSAIDAAIGTGAVSTVRKVRGVLVVPPGTYLITAPLNIQSVQGFSFIGAGKDITTFQFQPPGAVNNFLNIDGCANGRFQGFTVNCRGGGITDVAIDLNWTSQSAVGRSTTGNVFQDIVTGFTNSGGPRAGFGVGVRSGGNQVDDTTFYNCLANGFRTPNGSDTTKWQQGWALGNGTFGNVLGTYLFNCSAVRWKQGIAANATTFFLFGSQPTHNDVDFVVSNAGSSTIRAVRSELALRLLTTSPASSCIDVSLEDIHFLPNAIASDGQFIQIRNAGTYNISDLYLTTATGGSPNIQIQTSGDNPVQMVAQGIIAQRDLASFFNIPGPNVTATVINYTQTDSFNNVVKRTTHALLTQKGIIFTIGTDGQLAHAVNTLTVSTGSYNIDASKGDIAVVTLGGNVGGATITNPLTGQVLTIEFLQDSTGNRTYTWPANCLFAGGAAPSASTTGGFRDSVTFRYDGTSWLETSRSVAVR